MIGNKVQLYGNETLKAEQGTVLAHIPELDGLRGTAIMLVLIVHLYTFANFPQYLNSAHPKWSPLWHIADFGWTGVDLFFVLSGFLITTILFNTRKSPNYLRAFYGRRALRIFPLYILVVFLYFHTSTPVSVFVQAPEEATGHEIWFWTYLANWKLGLWPPGPLSHFWSLCVEEQFYFVWPAVVWLCPRRRFPWVCLVVVGLSAAAGFVFEWREMPKNFVFMASVPRVNSIVAGAWLAWAVRQSWIARVIDQLRIALPALLGALLILALWPADFPGRYSSQFVVIAVAFSALVLSCTYNAGSGGLTNRMMRWAALRAFGRYSYAIYIFHQLVFRVTANFMYPKLQKLRLSPDMELFTLMVIMVVSCFVVGVVSWYAVETHFLRLKRYLGYQAMRSQNCVEMEVATASD